MKNLPENVIFIIYSFACEKPSKKLLNDIEQRYINKKIEDFNISVTDKWHYHNEEFYNNYGHWESGIGLQDYINQTMDTNTLLQWIDIFKNCKCCVRHSRDIKNKNCCRCTCPCRHYGRTIYRVLVNRP